jgi:hypothetical protein
MLDLWEELRIQALKVVPGDGRPSSREMFSAALNLTSPPVQLFTVLAASTLPGATAEAPTTARADTKLELSTTAVCLN